MTIKGYLKVPKLTSIGILINLLFPFLLLAQPIEQNKPDKSLSSPSQQLTQDTLTKDDAEFIESDSSGEEIMQKPLVDTTIVIPLLDFKNTNIRDVLNALAQAYKLNIWLDESVSGNITIHSEKIPLYQVLNLLIEENNLDAVKSDQIIKLYKREEILIPPPLDIKIENSQLWVDLKDADLENVVRTLVREGRRNIVIEKGVTGNISGVLKDISFDKGFKALMTSNGFLIKEVEGVYHVDKTVEAPGVSRRRIYNISYREGFLTLDVADANLDQVINEISNQCDLDIFIYGKLDGQVSAKCNGLSVEDALNYIFKGTDYTFRIEKKVYFIGKKETEGMADSRLIKLNHLVAEKIVDLLPQSLAAKAAIKVVKEQNSLMVTGHYNVIDDIQSFIREIDYQPAQILIEALVVDYYETAFREVGIEADNYGLTRPSSSRETYYPDVDVFTFGEHADKTLQDISSRLGIANIGHLSDNFYIRLHAMEEEGKANVRSRPQIATLNGHKAKMDVGTTQYYLLKTETVYPGAQQALSTQVTEKFQTIEASMSLEIIPWVTAKEDIIVQIHPEFNTPKGAFDPDVPPTIDHRIFDSVVRLRPGETIVLGGLIQTTEDETIKKFPILGSIPIIGRIFQNKSKTKINAELVIYLTPYVYYGSEGAVDVSKYKEK